MWEYFLRWGKQFRSNDRESFEAAVLKRNHFDGPRAMLQLADHRASARENGEELPELEAFSYEFPHKDRKTGKPSYRGVQELIAKLWDERLAILRAPTGAGKTDAALLWAQHQIESGRADRLVIAMPTRFTSNALAINAAQNLSNVGIYHSTAYFNRKTREKNQPDFSERWIEKEQELARIIETPVCVTTLDHLCIALTGAREDHHSIFWGLAHSCVVIDEADFYDEFTQYNLVTLLRALRVLDVRVLIMSATVPASSRELYGLCGTPISQIHEDKSDLTRSRCQVHVGRSVALPEDIVDLLEHHLDGTPLIIYANTVKRAQAYVDWFKNRGFDDFVLYHSRFTEPDKARKEEQLIQMLGKDAWQQDEGKRPTAHGVAILTQIGELSVNISANVMISDLCPIDRLAQRAGRLARFGLQVGQLHVVTPLRADKSGATNFYPAPYGEFLGKDGWKATEPLLQTQQWLKGKEMNAQNWIDGVNIVYPSLRKPASRTIQNQDKLEKSLVINWLIVQAAQVSEDDDGTKDWKCRDIPPQQKVYVCRSNPSIVTEQEEIPTNWRQFREWETEAAISVLSYELKTALKNGTLEELDVVIGEDTEKIFIAKPSAYSLERGLVLTPQQDETEEWNPHEDD